MSQLLVSLFIRERVLAVSFDTQIEGPVSCSAYHPLLPLLSSALLRLSLFTSHFTDNDGPPAGKDRPPTAKDGPPAGKDRPPTAKDRPPAAKDGPPAAKVGTKDGRAAGKDGRAAGKDGRAAGKDGPAAGKDDPLSMCQEGLDLLERSVLHPDLCLKSSLISQKGQGLIL